MPARRDSDQLGARDAPDIDHDRLSDWDDTRPLEHGFEIEDARIGPAAGLAGVRASGGRIRHSALAGTVLAGARLRSLDLVDVLATDDEAANADLTGARLRRVTFERCRMTGLGAGELDAEDVTFRDCKLDLAGFHGARLRRTTFERCVMVEADLGAAQLIDVRFSDCELARVEIQGMRLARVDLRGSRLDEPRGDVGALRGAIVGPVQLVGLAAVLAAGLGIEVRDQ